MEGAAGDVDRISALPDDLLHVILGCVESAPVVARTAVLSRRWRYVWPHAKSLTFQGADRDLKKKGDLSGFVDWVLAQRGDADMESLEIRFTRKGRSSPEKVSEWLRYAARRVVGSVDVHLGRPPRDEHDEPNNDNGDEDEAAVELPSHGGRTTFISLCLSDYMLRLPATATARYEALTELQLWSVRFGQEVAGSSNQLGDFVMSCCPRLRRLHVSGAEGLTQLVLRTEVLQELSINDASDLKTLDVVAPNLRVLELDLLLNKQKVVARIVAPRLEEIHGDFHQGREGTGDDLDIRGLESVRLIKYLQLDMHGKYRRATVWPLENCPAVEHVYVCARHSAYFHHHATTDELVDLTSAPLFASVRTMAISSLLPKHHLVASISSLLMRCPHLTSLSVHIISSGNQSTWGYKCLCEALADRCTIHGKLALDALREVKMTGFRGTDEEMQLVSLLFGSAMNSIERMRIELKLRVPANKKRIGSHAQKIFHKLTTMKIPCAGQDDQWSFTKKGSEQTFAWTCDWTRMESNNACSSSPQLVQENFKTSILASSSSAGGKFGRSVIIERSDTRKPLSIKWLICMLLVSIIVSWICYSQFVHQ